jgi:hypothetical protein
MSTTPNNQTSNNPQSKAEDTDRQPSPAEVRDVFLIWLRNYWNAPRQKSKWTEIATVVLTLLIAGAAFWSAWIFQGQLTEARNATNLSEKQWKNQQVPWLELEDNAVSISPAFQFSDGPPLPYPSVFVGPINYVIKNFGPAPAFHEWDSVHVVPNPDGQKPEKLIEVLCQMREGIGKGHAETTGGEILFPGAEKHVGWTTNISPSSKQTHFGSVWLIVCVSYEDSWNRVHHSRFVYMTTPGPESGSTPIAPNPAHPDWTYIPIQGVYLNDAQAD